MIGQTISNYEIKSMLGEGGMGTVYLAEHAKLGRKVAIKVLLPHLLKNELVRSRFVNEAKLMSSLQHPNIVTLFDYIEDDNGLSLIMEYVQGQPLDEYIQEVSGPIPESDAIVMLKQALEGFSYAHKMGLVHRDIKPSNFIVTSDKKIKILDFGIAKLVGEAGNKLTKTGSHIGTVYYMSPEQVRGHELDLRSDIYALGVSFYQMLTGVCPYDGLTTEFDVFNKIVADELPDPRIIYPGISEHMNLVIQKATAKKVEDRFQSCDEFIQGLLQLDFFVAAEAATQAALKTDEPINEEVEIQEDLIHENNPEDEDVDVIPENPSFADSGESLQNTKPKKKNKVPIFILLGLVVVVLLVFITSNGSSTSSDDDRDKSEYTNSNSNSSSEDNSNTSSDENQSSNSQSSNASANQRTSNNTNRTNQGPSQEEINARVADKERNSPLDYISFSHDGGHKTIIDNIKINVDLSNRATQIIYNEFVIEVTYYDKNGDYKGGDSQAISTLISPGYRLTKELKFIPPFGVKSIDVALVSANAVN